MIVAAPFKLLRRLLRAIARAAKNIERLVFGAAVRAGELGRVEPVERRELNVGDVDFRMFRRGADIEKVEFFALL